MSCYPLYDRNFKNCKYNLENDDDNIPSASTSDNRFQDERHHIEFDLVREKIKRLQLLCEESHASSIKTTKGNTFADASSAFDFLSHTNSLGLYSSSKLKSGVKKTSDRDQSNSKLELIRNEYSSVQQFTSFSCDVEQDVEILKHLWRGREQDKEKKSKEHKTESPPNLKRTIIRAKTASSLCKPLDQVIANNLSSKTRKTTDQEVDPKLRSERLLLELENKFYNLSSKINGFGNKPKRSNERFPSFCSQPQLLNESEKLKEVKKPILAIETSVSIEVGSKYGETIKQTIQNDDARNKQSPSISHQNEEEIIDIILKSSGNLRSIELKNSNRKDSTSRKDSLISIDPEIKRLKANNEARTISDKYNSIDHESKLNSIVHLSPSPKLIKSKEIAPSKCIEFTLNGSNISLPLVFRKTVKFTGETEVIKYDEKKKVTTYMIYDERGEMIYDSNKCGLSRSNSLGCIFKENNKSKPKPKIKGILKNKKKMMDGKLKFSTIPANSGRANSNSKYDEIHAYSPNQSALHGLHRLLEECEGIKSSQFSISPSQSKIEAESSHISLSSKEKSKSLTKKQRDLLYLDKQIKTIDKIKKDRELSAERKKKENSAFILKSHNVSKEKLKGQELNKPLKSKSPQSKFQSKNVNVKERKVDNFKK